MKVWLILLSSLFFLEACSSIFSTPPPEPEKKEEVKAEEPEPEKKLTAVPARIDTKPQDPEPKKEEKASESAVREALKKRILVLSFLNKTPYGGKELAAHAASEVKSEIGKNTDQYIIVPEEEVDGYEDFVNSANQYNYKRIFERARSHGVAAIVTGVIEDLGIQEKGDEVGLFQTKYHTVNAQVRLNLFDAGSERTLMSKTNASEVTEEHTRFFSSNRSPDSYDSSRGSGAVSKALEKMFPYFMTQAKKIAWVGRIAKIDLHRYYINAGEMSGISRDQLLKVFGDGEPVIDQQSNQFLGMAPGRFKGILKVVDYFGTDGAIAIIHSGAGFREKDRVEIYSAPH